MANTTGAEIKEARSGSLERVVSPRDGASIAEELERSANIVASYADKHRDAMPPNVSVALTREIWRLRELAGKVKPTIPDDEEG